MERDEGQITFPYFSEWRRKREIERERGGGGGGGGGGGVHEAICSLVAVWSLLPDPPAHAWSLRCVVSLVWVSVPLLQPNLPCHYCSRAACLPACRIVPGWPMWGGQLRLLPRMKWNVGKRQNVNVMTQMRQRRLWMFESVAQGSVSHRRNSEYQGAGCYDRCWQQPNHIRGNCDNWLGCRKLFKWLWGGEDSDLIQNYTICS